MKTLKYAVVGESIGIMCLFDTRKEAEAWAAEIIDGYGEIYIREVISNVRKAQEANASIRIQPRCC